MITITTDNPAKADVWQRVARWLHATPYNLQRHHLVTVSNGTCPTTNANTPSLVAGSHCLRCAGLLHDPNTNPASGSAACSLFL